MKKNGRIALIGPSKDREYASKNVITLKLAGRILNIA